MRSTHQIIIEPHGEMKLSDPLRDACRDAPIDSIEATAEIDSSNSHRAECEMILSDPSSGPRDGTLSSRSHRRLIRRSMPPGVPLFRCRYDLLIVLSIGLSDTSPDRSFNPTFNSTSIPIDYSPRPVSSHSESSHQFSSAISSNLIQNSALLVVRVEEDHHSADLSSSSSASI